MAIGRLSMKVGKAGKASAHAAYIARLGKYASRLEKGEKLEATEAGNMPAWAQHDPLMFWQAADAFERKNGTTYREMEIALPRELDPSQRADLVRDFVRSEIGDRHAYQWAIHVPMAADGLEQPHVHLMFSERQVDGIERDPDQYFKRYNSKSPEKGGARKGYGPSAGQTLSKAERAAELKALRQRWESLCNAHLERAGQTARIDMRSHAERGTGLEPERKQLPSEWRGAGRAQVIGFRQARAELDASRWDLSRVVPDTAAEIISLEAERKAREERAWEAEAAHAAQDAWHSMNAVLVFEGGAPEKRRTPWQEWRAKTLAERYGLELAAKAERQVEDWYIKMRPDLGGLHIRDKAGREVIDADTVIKAEHSDGIQDIPLILELAKAKGWKSLEFTGSDEFKRAAAVAALDAGLAVADKELQQSAEQELDNRRRLDGIPNQQVQAQSTAFDDWVRTLPCEKGGGMGFYLGRVEGGHLLLSRDHNNGGWRPVVAQSRKLEQYPPGIGRYVNTYGPQKQPKLDEAQKLKPEMLEKIPRFATKEIIQRAKAGARTQSPQEPQRGKAQGIGD